MPDSHALSVATALRRQAFGDSYEPWPHILFFKPCLFAVSIVLHVGRDVYSERFLGFNASELDRIVDRCFLRVVSICKQRKKKLTPLRIKQMEMFSPPPSWSISGCLGTRLVTAVRIETKEAVCFCGRQMARRRLGLGQSAVDFDVAQAATTPQKPLRFFIAWLNCDRGVSSVCAAAHAPTIAFRHLPPNSARTGCATEGALFIAAQLSADAVSAFRKV